MSLHRCKGDNKTSKNYTTFYSLVTSEIFENGFPDTNPCRVCPWHCWSSGTPHHGRRQIGEVPHFKHHHSWCLVTVAIPREPSLGKQQRWEAAAGRGVNSPCGEWLPQSCTDPKHRAQPNRHPRANNSTDRHQGQAALLRASLAQHKCS